MAGSSLRRCLIRTVKILIVGLMLIVILAYIVTGYQVGGTKDSPVKKIPFPQHQENYINTLTWIVNIKMNETVDEAFIDKLAYDANLKYVRKFRDLDDHFIFAYVRDNVTNLMQSEEELGAVIDKVEDDLQKNPMVNWFSHQKIVSRSKRWMNFTDPFYREQWHLVSYPFLKQDLVLTCLIEKAWKTLRQNKKMLMISIFSFCLNIFSAILYKFKLIHKLAYDTNLEYVPNFCDLEDRLGTNIDKVEDDLQKNPMVNWFSHQKIVSRSKRWMNFTDPYYREQWHLTNTYNYGMDTNVTGVWLHNITGKGVTVSIVDDGVEWNNPDLEANYNAEGSWDFNGDDNDPMPDGSKESNHHGTRCAGEVAAVPNNVCAVGVAYGAKVSGLRILDGPMTDSLEAEAFTKFFHINDIYSCSWGPDDDGKTVDGPHFLAAAAMKHGIDFGRHGYGSIYVVASGNGGVAADNCNYDGYANSIYTVTIGAVDETGHMPFYGEECASMLAVTFSNGGSLTRDIVTTDWTANLERSRTGCTEHHTGTSAAAPIAAGLIALVTTDWTANLERSRTGCTEHHTGTSAAAPIAAGLIALVLDAQPCLTWRDVQYIIILTALKVDVDVAHWQKNGAGLWHSHKHGFGLMNAWRLVNAAKTWSQVPWMTSFSFSNDEINLPITKGRMNPLEVSHTVTQENTNGFDLYILETVQVTLTLEHPCRGYLDIRLKSPHGTMSVLGATRPNDMSKAGFDQWTFSTVRCWGETPAGTWTLIMTDNDYDGMYGNGVLQSWELKLYGTPMSQQQLKKRRRAIERAMDGSLLNTSSVCFPSLVTTPPDSNIAIERAMDGSLLNISSVCFPPHVTAPPDSNMSVKTLKILSLMGVFLLGISIYETLESLLCFNKDKEEYSRRQKLIKRAHLLVNQALRAARRQERTGSFSEEIPMQTFHDHCDVDIPSQDQSDLQLERSRSNQGHLLDNHRKSSKPLQDCMNKLRDVLQFKTTTKDDTNQRNTANENDTLDYDNFTLSKTGNNVGAKDNVDSQGETLVRRSSMSGSPNKSQGHETFHSLWNDLTQDRHSVPVNKGGYTLLPNGSDSE